MSATPPNMQMLESIGLKGRVCAWVKLSPPGVYFVIFLGPMLIATGRPVEPINAVNGSHDVSWWHSHLYMVRIIKIMFFSIFDPKIFKIALRPMATSRSYNSATLRMRAHCLIQTGGFRGRPIERCPSNLPPTDPCCHGNQPLLFE